MTVVEETAVAVDLGVRALANDLVNPPNVQFSMQISA